MFSELPIEPVLLRWVQAALFTLFTYTVRLHHSLTMFPYTIPQHHSPALYSLSTIRTIPLHTIPLYSTLFHTLFTLFASPSALRHGASAQRSVF